MVQSQPLPTPDPLAPESFRGYTLLPVYRRTTEAQRTQAIDFWLGHRVMSGACVAERRSHELVYVALTADGQMAGLTSVSLGRRGHDGRNVYDFRIFIAPPHRSAFLARGLMNRSRDLLQADSLRWPAAGMRLFAEDPKLCRPGIRRYLERQGYLYRGQNRQGQDLWFAPFPPNT
jgi:hypothetical protein